MKNDIINTDVLSTYLSEYRGTIALLNLIIHILEQIRDWLEDGKRQCASQPFTLEDYKHFNLTDEQIRKAIVRLRKDGKKKKKERRWVTSTNGTYLNATPVITHSDGKDGLKVFTGEIITVGEYKIKVE